MQLNKPNVIIPTIEGTNFWIWSSIQRSV